MKVIPCIGSKRGLDLIHVSAFEVNIKNARFRLPCCDCIINTVLAQLTLQTQQVLSRDGNVLQRPVLPVEFLQALLPICLLRCGWPIGVPHNQVMYDPGSDGEALVGELERFTVYFFRQHYVTSSLVFDNLCTTIKEQVFSGVYTFIRNVSI